MTVLHAHEAHTHQHEHEHEHEDPHEHEHPFAEGAQHHGASVDATVVLDIGGHIGAVALYTDAGLLGVEIDIVGLDAGTVSTHSLVRERQLPDGTVGYAAVYPDLPQGRYRIPASTGLAARELHVRGGSVCEVDASTDRL